MALGQLARREGDVPFTKNNARGKASLTPGTRSLQRQQAVARKLATKSQKAQRGGVLPLHERPASPCSVIMEADMETVGATALKGARVALHGAKVAGGYGISTARVAGSYSLIASKALYAMAATLWASLAVACAVLVGGMCFLVSTLFEMSRRVKVASRGFVKVAQFAGRSMKLSIQASSYAGRVFVAMWTRITAGCSRGFEASLALFVVVSGLCLEAFLRARTAGAARAAPFLRKHAPMAADMLFESPKKNDDCEEALLLDRSARLPHHQSTRRRRRPRCGAWRPSGSALLPNRPEYGTPSSPACQVSLLSTFLSASRRSPWTTPRRLPGRIRTRGCRRARLRRRSGRHQIHTKFTSSLLVGGRREVHDAPPPVREPRLITRRGAVRALFCHAAAQLRLQGAQTQ
jgi:hypothetical protein